MLHLFRSPLYRKPKIPKKAESLSVAGRAVEVSRRAYKRSLGLTLKMNGTIRVSAPKGLALSKIRDFVASQEAWIESNLKRYESVREAYPQKRMSEGETFPFLGEQLSLTFEAVHKKPGFKIQDGRLICGIRADAWPSFDPNDSHPDLIQPLVAFYKARSREVLGHSVQKFSERMGLFPTGLSFRAQRTRWGSCSSKGRISLNWKLIVAPIETIDYVVVHELAHLKFYDHSQAFWRLVATQSPDFAHRREWLKQNQFLADFLSAESELHPGANAQ